MTISHDPNHSHSAGLVLSEGAEETAEATGAGKAPGARAARSSVGFWAWMVMFLLGVAALGTGLIFYSVQPGVLSLEGMGAGVGVLVLCLLLVVGARRLVEAPAGEAPKQTEATPEPADTSVSPEPPLLSAVPSAAPPESPPAVSPTLPTSEAALSVPVEPVSAPASATQAEAAAEASPAPAAPKPKPARKPTKSPEEESAQNGQMAEEELPALADGQADTSAPEEIAMPSLAQLPERYHLSTTHAVIDEEADDLGDLLGRVAEQSALAMATKGARGAQRRANLAEKIEQFQQEMARDPEYTPVANFFESMAALLRAGTLIPPVKRLEDPFDGLYQYVLTLVRRRM